MPLEGEYEPSPAQWVHDQVELYESSGGTQGTTLWDTGLPVVIVTMRGAKSGKIRKIWNPCRRHDRRTAHRRQRRPDGDNPSPSQNPSRDTPCS